MNCEETYSRKTRIRGWHNSYPCRRDAAYRVEFTDGEVKHVCGCHLSGYKRGYYTKDRIKNVTKLSDERNNETKD